MLRQLSIKNFALIRDIDVRFESGLNIITGETGAGKSMLVGALGLILGNRADLQVIGKNGDKCSIEGIFDLKGLNLQEFFGENDLDFADETVVRRELNTAGKSRSFINDTPVGLQQLKELASNLVSFHSQHENLSLGNMDFQFTVLDNFAGNNEELLRFQTERRALLKLKVTIEALEAEIRRQNSDEDYNRFLLNELDEAAFTEGEEEALETEHRRLANAGALQEGIAQALALLETDETGLLDQLRKLSAILDNLKKIDDEIDSMASAVSQQLSDFKQNTRELSSLAENIGTDDARLAQVNERLQLIYNLCRKHKVQNIDELIALREKIRGALGAMDKRGENLDEMRTQYEKALTELHNIAGKLYACRTAILPDLEKEINAMLVQVGMPHARLKAELYELPDEEFNNFGRHSLRFVFAPNPGSDFLPLEKIASGGELSRIMLVIKSLIAGVQHLPTLIFDEIDTGISGETALRVGHVMHSLARNHQLICITHLPQIACYADAQFHISKKVENGGTSTYMFRLDAGAREQELARMLGGDNFSNKALDNARELLAIVR